MSSINKQAMATFLEALGTGDVERMASILAPSVEACAMGIGSFSVTRDRATILEAAGMLMAAVPAGIAFEVVSLTEEGDRVVAEVKGRALLADGTPYNNSYAFVAEMSDGKIAHLNEYYCTLLVEQVLVPFTAKLVCAGERGLNAAMALIPSFDDPGINRQVRLRSRPAASPQAADFTIAEATVPDCGVDQVLVRNLYLSADPVQRGWIARPDMQREHETVRALAVGVVVRSRIASIPEGDVVYGIFGWQDFAVVSRADILCHVGQPRLPASAYAGALGMPGVTAWLALNDIAPPGPGQTVLVSTAAGTVGSIAGQIAAHQGARAIGLTGSDEKVRLCVERFGYDAAFNYKAGDLDAVLAEAAPSGIDTFYDNTGGAILDTAIRRMKRYGRIIACGTAATPSWAPPPTGLRNEREVLMRALTWTGFVIFDHADRFEDAVGKLADLAESRGLAFEEDIDSGMEAVPHALPAVLAGANTGKKLVFIGRD